MLDSDTRGAPRAGSHVRRVSHAIMRAERAPTVFFFLLMPLLLRSLENVYLRLPGMSCSTKATIPSFPLHCSGALDRATPYLEVTANKYLGVWFFAHLAKPFNGGVPCPRPPKKKKTKAINTATRI